MTKEHIRSQQKALRNSLSFDERKELSTKIKNRLFHTKAFLYAKKLFLFVSLPDEVDTHSIIIESIKKGKEVYVPRVEGRKMEFYQITDLNLVRSKYGIMEPKGMEELKFKQDSHLWETSASILHTKDRFCNLMLLPGLAFDRKGNRIGYGAGYYDKYLASFPETTFFRMALAFDFQLLEEIPSEDYDKKVYYIITPTEVCRCDLAT